MTDATQSHLLATDGAARMKVLALPRDPNPYQELLHAALRERGIQVAYLGRSTPLQSLNVLLLPFELAARRATGARIVHLHWVWAFDFFLMPPSRARRWLAYGWFRLFLATIRLLGMKLAWTAHNILPHDQVFPDDSAARRLLIQHCDIVFGHSAWTLAALTELGARPRRWVAIRHPPFDSQGSWGSPGPRELPRGRLDGARREFIFFGKILEYKGLEELLEAFAGLSPSVAARLTVAGECDDPRLRTRIEELARRSGDRVALRIGRVPDCEVGPLMNSAHVAVLPFRRVTTSGSAMLALGYGKPLIVPDLPPLGELPAGAVFRYDGSVTGLTEILRAAGTADGESLDRMSQVALAYAGEATWAQVAETTAREFRGLVS
jgi:glycosyltransferase involved in cell wall biosynthesis